MGRGVLDDRALGALVQVVGDHRAIALAQGAQATFDGLAGESVGADQALALERGESRVDLAVLEDIQVVAIGMHQHQFDPVGLQALQAALDGAPGMRGGEVED